MAGPRISPSLSKVFDRLLCCTRIWHVQNCLQSQVPKFISFRVGRDGLLCCFHFDSLHHQGHVLFKVVHVWWIKWVSRCGNPNLHLELSFWAGWTVEMCLVVFRGPNCAIRESGLNATLAPCSLCFLSGTEEYLFGFFCLCLGSFPAMSSDIQYLLLAL